MRPHRLLAVPVLVAILLTAGCAGPGQEELENVQAMTIAPGTNASAPFVVNASEVDGQLEADDVSIEASEEGLETSLAHLEVDEEGDLAGWYTVSAGEELDEGQRSLAVSLGDAERTVPVTVETPEEPLETGEVAQLSFTLRTQEGELVLTNDENATESPLPRTSSFREPQAYQPVPIQLSEQNDRLPDHLVEALLGAGVGHSRSVQVEEFFGPETIEENRSRETAVERRIKVPTEVSYPPQQARQVVPRDAQQGDEVDLPVTQQGHRVPYVIEEMGRQEIGFSLALAEGENFTLYEAWPDTAEVTNVTEEEATIYETPGVGEGDKLTWVDSWGNVTEVVSLTDETIRLRHSPAEGFTYERMDQRAQQRVEFEIVDVGPDEIVLEKTNPHPLAGQTLVFDVTVADRGAPQQAGQQQRR